MNVFSYIYQNLLYNPIFTTLIFFYQIFGNDLGLAIIALTLTIRIIIFPITSRAILSQRKMSALQPHIKEIQEKHKDNREEQAKQTMALYKEHKINPLSGIGNLFIQLPIMIALYRVLLAGLKHNNGFLFNPLFLGVLNLSSRNLYLGILVGLSQYISSKLIFSATAMQNQTQKQMIYFMPAFMTMIAATLPAGISLYLLMTVNLSSLEQKIINYYERRNKKTN